MQNGVAEAEVLCPELYEDDGLTYGYEKGSFATIPFHWDDASRNLTIGERTHPEKQFYHSC